MQQIVRKTKNLIRRIKVMKNWYAFIKPFTQMGTWPRTAHLRSGAKFIVESPNSSSFAIFNEIVIDDTYSIEKFSSPKKILDIGANIGTFAITAAKRFPDAHIIAFEPEEKNFEQLKQNIELSDAKNVTAVKKAITSKRGVATLHLDPKNPGAHNLYEGGDGQSVETVPLTDFLPADVLKIDAEGAEYEIFANEIPDCKRIVMEAHEGNNDELLAKFAPRYHISSHDKIHILTHK